MHYTRARELRCLYGEGAWERMRGRNRGLLPSGVGMYDDPAHRGTHQLVACTASEKGDLAGKARGSTPRSQDPTRIA
jgi:hypothetical protein